MKVAGINMLDLGRKQVELFEANNLVYMEALVNCYSPRQILVYVYHQLVRLQKITAIEDMLLEHKEMAWNTAKDVAKGRLGKSALIDLVKALLTLEYFLSIEKN